MKCEKEGKFLVFTKEDGALAKFDLSTSECWRFYQGKLRSVKQLNNFFKGVDVDDVINEFSKTNYAYGEFIKSIAKAECLCSNVGTFLNRLHRYANLENYHLLGISVSYDIKVPTSYFPKDILRIFSKHNISIRTNFVKACEEFGGLIFNSLRYIDNKYNESEKQFLLVGGQIIYPYIYRIEYFFDLVEKYNYEYKSLIDYLYWHIPRYEGIEGNIAVSLLHDYARMKTRMDVKFEKYPKFLRSVHDITTLAYNKFEKEYSAELFKKTVDKSYNWSYNGYIIRCAETADEVKNEGAQLSHCVASYVEDIIDGTSLILFMRKENEPEKSLLTIEVKRRHVNQARGYLNRYPNEEESKVIEKWAKEKNLNYRKITEVY